MTAIDVISGVFQWVAGAAVLLHVYTARKQGSVQGVNMVSLYFFAAWSLWNLIMFAMLAMPIAALCALFAGIADVTWLLTVRKLRK